ncbi:MAG: GNAT family N-acetyltransferase [Christensenellales bacterium]|jgi:ribosomal protein S18 acetylase RimI-like enzyme
MDIRFEKPSRFSRGILFELLKDAYSFDKRYQQHESANWRECDDFFFDNPQIADRYCFITTLKGEAVGFVSWDPRRVPEHVEIGHNCIRPTHKGKGYGKAQLQEAVERILQSGAGKIIVTTNDDLIPAQRMYESVGFKMHQRRKNEAEGGFVNEFIDYVYHPQRQPLQAEFEGRQNAE